MGLETVLEALRADHADIRGRMDALSGVVSSLEAAHSDESAGHVLNCQEQLSGFRKAFLAHRCREEIGLFPEVERLVAHGAPRVESLIGFFAGEADHDIRAHLAIEDGLRGMEPLLDSLVGTQRIKEAALSDLRDRVEKTRVLLLRHTAKEERVVFPVVARALTEEQSGTVTERLRDLCSGMEEES